MATKNAANVWYLCMSLVVIMSFLVIICGTIVAVLGGKSRYEEELVKMYHGNSTIMKEFCTKQHDFWKHEENELTKVCHENSTMMEKFCTKQHDFCEIDIRSYKVEELVLVCAIPKYSDYVTPLEEIAARVGIVLIKSIVVIFSILVGTGAILRYI